MNQPYYKDTAETKTAETAEQTPSQLSLKQLHSNHEGHRKKVIPE